MGFEEFDSVSVFELEGLDLRDDVLQLPDALGSVVLLLVGLGLDVVLHLRLGREGAGASGLFLHRFRSVGRLPVELVFTLLLLRIPFGLRWLRRLHVDLLLMMTLLHFDLFRIVARFSLDRIHVFDFRELHSFRLVLTGMGNTCGLRFFFGFFLFVLPALLFVLLLVGVMTLAQSLPAALVEIMHLILFFVGVVIRRGLRCLHINQLFPILCR